MTLKCEVRERPTGLVEAIVATIRDVTKLRGEVELVDARQPAERRQGDRGPAQVRLVQVISRSQDVTAIHPEVQVRRWPTCRAARVQGIGAIAHPEHEARARRRRSVQARHHACRLPGDDQRAHGKRSDRRTRNSAAACSSGAPRPSICMVGLSALARGIDGLAHGSANSRWSMIMMKSGKSATTLAAPSCRRPRRSAAAVSAMCGVGSAEREQPHAECRSKHDAARGADGHDASCSLSSSTGLARGADREGVERGASRRCCSTAAGRAGRPSGSRSRRRPRTPRRRRRSSARRTRRAAAASSVFLLQRVLRLREPRLGSTAELARRARRSAPGRSAFAPLIQIDSKMRLTASGAAAAR